MNTIDSCIRSGGCLPVFGVALLVLSASGCSSDDGMIPIRGEVIYNGQPLAEGQVVYMPTDPGIGRQASGAIQPDGSFEMMTLKRGDGVMEGEYAIAIYAYKPHPGEPTSRAEVEALAQRGGEIKREHLVPEKYASPVTSGLSDKVDSSHSGFKKIELSD